MSNMKSVKGLFKKLLRIDKLDEDDDIVLDDHIQEYSAIINSSKYADSNSNTEALEKLLAKLDINKEPDGGPSLLDTQTIPPAPNKAEINSPGNKLDSDLSANFANVDTAVDDGQNFKVKFSDRLALHMKLINEIEEGEATVLPAQPVFERARFQQCKLPLYNIPKHIYSAIEPSNAKRFHIVLEGPNNYVNVFQTLLWLEEAHQSVEMHRYDIENTMLAEYSANVFLLTVPGLAEGRPSLMRGDKVMLQSNKRSTCYEGFINEVREKDVTVKLHQSISSLNGLTFDVRFLLSRTPFRRCHYGIDQVKRLRGIIFPSEASSNNLPKLAFNHKELPISMSFNESLNEYQRRAVANILRATNRPAPYIVFGPPGTGKTVTLIEAILQVYKLQPNYRILVCANSNSSVDLCARRIKMSRRVPLDQMVRVAAFYRVEKDLIPDDIKDVTLDMDGLGMSDFNQYRIFVTTCIQAGALYNYTKRFDYVFIDEAGHSSEPESMIALGLMKPDGCCVLAGDPHQLGPVCISEVASRNGLGTSLLERLALQPIYKCKQAEDGSKVYNIKYITKLLISYRCDPEILAISSKLFYDGDLKCANRTPAYWLKSLKIKKPIVFHAVTGRDRREYMNPSWFNPNEAIRVLTYVKRLYDAGLRSHQLGIITPYRRQIEKLSLLLTSVNLPECKIGTMEEFQGEEREVIIISTVRTREKKLALDKKFNLGFLFNPKRFNVAISRAKWLVIVVGDPTILNRDHCWKMYIESAHNFVDEPREGRNL